MGLGWGGVGVELDGDVHFVGFHCSTSEHACGDDGVMWWPCACDVVLDGVSVWDRAVALVCFGLCHPRNVLGTFCPQYVHAWASVLGAAWVGVYGCCVFFVLFWHHTVAVGLLHCLIINIMCIINF